MRALAPGGDMRAKEQSRPGRGRGSVSAAVPEDRCNGECDAAVRLAALRALLQLVVRDNPTHAKPDELTAAVARAFARGCNANALMRSGVMPSEVAMAALRLLL